jgi:Olfactomedin-like domain
MLLNMQKSFRKTSQTVGHEKVRRVAWIAAINSMCLLFSGTKELPGLKSTTKANDTNFLYSTGYNVMDFNVDDNGLWVIYAVPFSNYTFVAKVSRC